MVEASGASGGCHGSSGRDRSVVRGEELGQHRQHLVGRGVGLGGRRDGAGQRAVRQHSQTRGGESKPSRPAAIRDPLAFRCRRRCPCRPPGERFCAPCDGRSPARVVPCATCGVRGDRPSDPRGRSATIWGRAWRVGDLGAWDPVQVDHCGGGRSNRCAVAPAKRRAATARGRPPRLADSGARRHRSLGSVEIRAPSSARLAPAASPRHDDRRAARSSCLRTTSRAALGP
jgi:hypothetical protein